MYGLRSYGKDPSDDLYSVTIGISACAELSGNSSLFQQSADGRNHDEPVLELLPSRKLTAVTSRLEDADYRKQTNALRPVSCISRDGLGAADLQITSSSVKS